LRPSLQHIEYSHLARRAFFSIFWAERLDLHTVPKTLRDALRPSLEFRARPFEAVIGVTELSGGQRLKSRLYSRLGVVTITVSG
jgi:hypothetical protein